MLREASSLRPNRGAATLLLRSSSSRVLCTSTIARIANPRNAAQLEKLLLPNEALQFLQTCSIALVIRSWFSLHFATALVVSFLGKRAVELSAFHFTTALIHRPACFAASHLLSRAKCGRCKNRKDKTNA